MTKFTTLLGRLMLVSLIAFGTVACEEDEPCPRPWSCPDPDPDPPADENPPEDGGPVDQIDPIDDGGGSNVTRKGNTTKKKQKELSFDAESIQEQLIRNK